MSSRAILLIAALAASAGSAFAIGCSGDDTVHDEPDSGLPAQDAGGGGSDATSGGDTGTGSDAGPGDDASDCVQDPQTSVDLLNACTDAVKIDKHPVLPLLLADGGLPPLPQ